MKKNYESWIKLDDHWLASSFVDAFNWTKCGSSDIFGECTENTSMDEFAGVF